jgi:hypothetical protein
MHHYIRKHEHTWHNKSVNRSWLASRFFNVVSFVYNSLACQRQLRWSANPVTSNVGYAEPQGFLARLSEEELAVVLRVHSLADEIQVESLSDEGAMNLLLPSAAQVDLNHDGLTRSGRAYGIRFPDSSTPPKVVSAWEQVTAGMHWSERINYEIQMLMPLLTANLVSDESGQFLYAPRAGRSRFRQPVGVGRLLLCPGDPRSSRLSQRLPCPNFFRPIRSRHVAADVLPV